MGGTYVYGKREAEAEPKAAADPYLLYGGYYGHGLGYYGGYYGHGLAYYGKREAEAEPKAAADPYPLYGGYGLGYRTYGYPYVYGHYYGKREAEAKADPYYYGGYFGHGLGYGYD